LVASLKIPVNCPVREDNFWVYFGSSARKCDFVTRYIEIRIACGYVYRY